MVVHLVTVCGTWEREQNYPNPCMFFVLIGCGLSSSRSRLRTVPWSYTAAYSSSRHRYCTYTKMRYLFDLIAKEMDSDRLVALSTHHHYCTIASINRREKTAKYTVTIPYIQADIFPSTHLALVDVACLLDTSKSHHIHHSGGIVKPKEEGSQDRNVEPRKNAKSLILLGVQNQRN